ncbi:MAG: hypothetical protein J6S41_03645 [Clostridia bacterium]|nr:hypothetical protein [Clostridia bacterium]
MFDYEYRKETTPGRVCLEVSLKPFGYDKSPAGIEAVARKLFSQWMPLLRYATGCSLLFWTSDGSEILDYSGNPDDTFNWCKYIGIGNWNRDASMEECSQKNSLHAFPIHYMENPPEMTYGDLKTIIAIMKRIGREMTGFDIAVGETFDPGPEFAWSDFKFNRHTELAVGSIMGASKWIHCASRLHADDRHYAAYPDGIPEGTHFGEFLGRQFMAMKRDLGFDYLWLSNGFGFSLQSWNWTGELFDGTRFDFAHAAQVRQSIAEFWRYFSREVGNTRIETRGSNLSTGMDIAAHGCPNEVTPHLLTAYNDYPDEAGLVTWIYPFDSYCKQGLTDGHSERIFMDDWFIESAIDHGFPINTVISDRNFIASDKQKLKNTILVTAVPEADSPLENAILAGLNDGLRIILFGTTAHASKAMLNAIGVSHAEPIDGEMQISTTLPLDTAEIGQYADTLVHHALLSDGGICEIAKPDTAVTAQVTKNGICRTYATVRGSLVWVRGSFPHDPNPRASLPNKLMPGKSFVSSILLRASLSLFGYHITFSCYDINDNRPILHFSRCRRALWLNEFSKDATVKLHLSTPDGAPAFDNTEFLIEDSVGTYPTARWIHTDCRVFIKQKAPSKISIRRDAPHTHIWLDERMFITGLVDAEVTVYPSEGGTVVARTGDGWDIFNGGNVPLIWDEEKQCYHAYHITGNLNVCPRDKEHIDDWKPLEFLRDPDHITEH